MRWLSLFLLVLFLLPPAALAADAPAEVSVFVFSDGVPKQGVPITIGSQRARTGRLGEAHLSVPAGDYQAAIGQAGGLHAAPLLLMEGERLQIIVTAVRGAPAVVEITTSVPDKVARSARPLSDEGLPPGLLVGRIVSSEDRQPVARAQVFIAGTPFEAETNGEGRFTIELPAGRYTLSVIHSEFSTQTMEGVEVLAGKQVETGIEMSPSGLELEEFVVLAPHIEGSIASVLDEKRESMAVADVLGAAQIARSGDGDAAGALKRVTGLSVVDGKFVYVRGLGERYSSTLLNGASIPSPEPTRRVVPLDMIPADTLKSVVVQKSYSPDMPGEFGGGTIQLRTRGIPDEPVGTFSASLGVNTGTTGKEGLTYAGGGSDLLGFDDGSRGMPELVARLTDGGKQHIINYNPIFSPDGYTPAEIEAMGEAFLNTYEVTRSAIGPDLGLGVIVGNSGTLFGRQSGYLASFNYDQSWEHRSSIENTFGISGSEIIPADRYTATRTRRYVDLTGMFAAGMRFGDDHAIDATTLLVRKSTDTVRLLEGYYQEGDENIRDYTLEWAERQLITQQFHGEHRFEPLHELGVDWRMTVARANRYAPDTRSYRYAEAGGQYSFARGTLERNYADLTDNSTNIGADFSMPFGKETLRTTVKTGFDVLNKSRESSIVRYTYNWNGNGGTPPAAISGLQNPEDIFTPENIGPTGFSLADTTQPTDNYTADQSVTALYLMSDTEFGKTLRLMLGARQESSDQQVLTFNLYDPNNSPISAKLNTVDLLPAFSLTWFSTAEQQWRLGYSRTVSRPDFKELSEAPYVDPERGYLVIGNAKLQRALIDSIDLRWEWYWSPTESLAVALFGKQFQNPIEQIIIPGFDAPRSFANADGTTNYGIEVDTRVELGELGLGPRQFFLAGNVSLIDSQIQLGAGALGSATNSERPLQGQSPYMLNLQFGYDDEEAGVAATLLYNLFGPRITDVGQQGLPDIYEQPFHQLDFVYSNRIADSLKLGFKARNLLDGTVELLQGSDVVSSYRKGRDFSLNISWDF